MSINVTVTGNPVSIKRGKMITTTTDVENFKKKETQRRRKIRLEQVRQQSKDIANDVRQRVKRETENQLSSLEKKQGAELKKWQAKKLLSLQQQYNDCLEAVGTSHTEAALQPIPAEIMKSVNSTNAKKAKDRGKNAAKLLSEFRKCQDENQTAQMQRKVVSRNIENIRSSMVSSLSKGGPKRKTKQKLEVENNDPDLPNEDPEQTNTAKYVKKVSPNAQLGSPELESILEVSDDFKTQEPEQNTFRKPYDPRMYQDLSYPRYLQQPQLPPIGPNVYRPPACPLPGPPFDPNKENKYKIFDEERTYRKYFTKEYCESRDSPPRGSSPPRKDLPNEPNSLPTQVSSEEKKSAIDHSSYAYERIEPLRPPYDRRLSNLIKQRIVNQYNPSYPLGETLTSEFENGDDSLTKETTTSQYDPLMYAQCSVPSEQNGLQTSEQPKAQAGSSKQIRTIDYDNLSGPNAQHLTNSKNDPHTKATASTSERSRKTIPKPLPKTSLKSNLKDSSKKVQYYDHDNRYNRQYTASSDLVQRTSLKDRVDLLKSEQEHQVSLERDKQRSIIAKKRGREALEKEKNDRAYSKLMKDLSVIQKEERLATNHKTQSAAHLSKDRLQQKVLKQQQQMDAAFEEVYASTHHIPLITLEHVNHTQRVRSDVPFEALDITSSEVPTVNIATWGLPPALPEETVQDHQTVQNLLQRINYQRQLLLNEVAALPPSSNLQQILKDVQEYNHEDSDESKHSKKRRKKEASMSSTVPSTNVADQNDSTEQQIGNQCKCFKDQAKIPAHIIRDETEVTTIIDIEVEDVLSDETGKLPEKSMQIVKNVAVGSESVYSESTERPILRDSSAQTSMPDKIQGQVATSTSQIQIFIKLQGEEKRKIRSGDSVRSAPIIPKIVEVRKAGQRKLSAKKSPVLPEKITIRSSPTGDQSLPKTDNTNTTSSTSYLTPPKRYTIRSSKEQKHTTTDFNSFVDSADPPSTLDTATKQLIQTLLTMSRSSIENLGVSSASDATTPEVSVVHTRENMAIFDSDIESVINGFFRVPVNTPTEAIQDESHSTAPRNQPETSNQGDISDTERYARSRPGGSRAEILPEPSREHLDVVADQQTTLNETSEKYLKLAQFCTQKIDSLTAMIDKVRAETKELYETPSQDDSEPDSTAYLSLPPASDSYPYQTKDSERNTNVESTSKSNAPYSFKDMLTRDQVQSNAALGENILRHRTFLDDPHQPTQQTNLEKVWINKPAAQATTTIPPEPTFIPLLADIPKVTPGSRGRQTFSGSESSTVFEPHSGLTVLPRTLSSETSSSATSSVDRQPQTRPKPPVALLHNNMRHYTPLADAPVHELSTIIEADSTRNITQKSDAPKGGYTRPVFQRTVDEICEKRAERRRSHNRSRSLSPQTSHGHDRLEMVTQPSTSSSPQSRSPSPRQWTRATNRRPVRSVGDQLLDESPVEQQSPKLFNEMISSIMDSVDRGSKASEPPNANTIEESQEYSLVMETSDEFKNQSILTKSSSTNSLDDALKQLGLGWAIATLRKTQQSLQLSGGSTDVSLSRLGLVLSDSSIRDVSLKEILQREHLKRLSEAATTSSIENLTIALKDMVGSHTSIVATGIHISSNSSSPTPASKEKTKYYEHIEGLLTRALPPELLGMQPNAESYQNFIDLCAELISALFDSDISQISQETVEQFLFANLPVSAEIDRQKLASVFADISKDIALTLPSDGSQLKSLSSGRTASGNRLRSVSPTKTKRASSSTQKHSFQSEKKTTPPTPRSQSSSRNVRPKSPPQTSRSRGKSPSSNDLHNRSSKSDYLSSKSKRHENTSQSSQPSILHRKLPRAGKLSPSEHENEVPAIVWDLLRLKFSPRVLGMNSNTASYNHLIGVLGELISLLFISDPNVSESTQAENSRKIRSILNRNLPEDISLDPAVLEDILTEISENLAEEIANRHVRDAEKKPEQDGTRTTKGGVSTVPLQVDSANQVSGLNSRLTNTIKEILLSQLPINNLDVKMTENQFDIWIGGIAGIISSVLEYTMLKEVSTHELGINEKIMIKGILSDCIPKSLNRDPFSVDDILGEIAATIQQKYLEGNLVNAVRVREARGHVFAPKQRNAPMHSAQYVSRLKNPPEESDKMPPTGGTHRVAKGSQKSSRHPGDDRLSRWVRPSDRSSRSPNVTYQYKMREAISALIRFRPEVNCDGILAAIIQDVADSRKSEFASNALRTTIKNTIIRSIETGQFSKVSLVAAQRSVRDFTFELNWNWSAEEYESVLLGLQDTLQALQEGRIDKEASNRTLSRDISTEMTSELTGPSDQWHQATVGSASRTTSTPLPSGYIIGSTLFHMDSDVSVIPGLIKSDDSLSIIPPEVNLNINESINRITKNK